MSELPTSIIIIGATGDLNRRKLVPALYQLHRDNLLEDDTKVIGVARPEMGEDEYRKDMHDAIIEFSRSKPAADEPAIQKFLPNLHYFKANFTEPDSLISLHHFLGELDKARGLESGTGNRLYYLAIPPSVFWDFVSCLGETGHIHPDTDSDSWTRVVVEKPFGRDLESAKKLNQDILTVCNEKQIFRIDHYLGKETVQNIMAFRFGNSIFEPLWNRKYVDHVQITVAEQVTVGTRAGYYDNSGAMRDMVQNHILQLLALAAMEPPASFAPEAVRDEKVKVLSALRPISGDRLQSQAIRAQYTAGRIGQKNVPGYLDSDGVAAHSQTETFAALKAYVDNWRWADVPFFVRTGKGLSNRLSEITIVFRHPPLALFKHSGHGGHVPGDQMDSNTLTLRVQPNESIRLSFGMKIPGPDMILQDNHMEFEYSDVFGTTQPEAYERLILDAINGDSTLFIRHDEVEASWSFVDSAIKGWAAGEGGPMYEYAIGRWGPTEANVLLQGHGGKWIVGLD